jgi:hypothetical protein
MSGIFLQNLVYFLQKGKLWLVEIILIESRLNVCVINSRYALNSHNMGRWMGGGGE